MLIYSNRLTFKLFYHKFTVPKGRHKECKHTFILSLEGLSWKLLRFFCLGTNKKCLHCLFRFISFWQNKMAYVTTA